MRGRGTWRHGIVVASLVALGSSATSGGARAQGAAPQGKGAAAETQATAQMLASSDPVALRSALDDARVAGRGAASLVPAIAAALERGLPLSLVEPALETLGDIGVDAASPALSSFARHRVPSVRRLAVRALGRTGGGVAVKALRQALADPDEEVRAAAASGLGMLKAREAVRDLFAALDRRVGTAAAAIGVMCAPQECTELLSRLGRVPFADMAPALTALLRRAPSELPDDDKIKVLGRVRELGTPEVNRLLREVQGDWPKGGSPRVRQALDQAVLATGGAGGAS